jgi:CheY-like chemotaxis protein
MSVAPADLNAGRTLLVVDDQPNVRSSIAHYLEFCGYRTLRAESGLVAIEFARNQQIDGVLLDIHMPGLSGFDTCARLLAVAREAGKPMKVWFMTGAFSRGMDETCQQVGGLAIFRKPFDWPQLLAEVERGLLPQPSLPENTDAATSAQPEPQE